MSKDDKQQKSKITQDGKEADIPVEGSLGLLALGAVGLQAWRMKRQEMGIDVIKEAKKRADSMKDEPGN